MKMYGFTPETLIQMFDLGIMHAAAALDLILSLLVVVLETQSQVVDLNVQIG